MKQRLNSGQTIGFVLILLLLTLVGPWLTQVVAQSSGQRPDHRQPLATPTFPLGINPTTLPSILPTTTVGVPDPAVPPAQPQPTPAGRTPTASPVLSPSPGPSPTLPTQPDIRPELQPGVSPDQPLPPPPELMPDLRDAPKFMTLPFPADPRIQLLQGWYYDSKGLHQGVDFFRIDEQGRFTGFPILAVADGYACGQRDYVAPPSGIPMPTMESDNTAENRPRPGEPWADDPRIGSESTAAPTPSPTVASDLAEQRNRAVGGTCVSGFGDRVLIRHDIDGQTYYTYYGHLETIAAKIPIGSRGNTIAVKRGEVIGYAGNTGTGGGAPHLHFGLATPSFGWIDPYDIWTTHEVYPNTTGDNGRYAGPRNFWTTNPPSHSVEIRQLPEGAFFGPPDGSVVRGTVVITGWARVIGSEISRIELRVGGRVQGEAEYGLLSTEVEGNYGFRWEWDTSQETNGSHVLEVVAVAANGEEMLLPIANQLDTTEATETEETDTPADITERPEAQATATVAAIEARYEPIITQRYRETALQLQVDNLNGEVLRPPREAIVVGTTPIRGWARVSDGLIIAVEVWIDGELRGVADYGLPSPETGGNDGFLWEWDTTGDPNGTHQVEVRLVFDDGTYTVLENIIGNTSESSTNDTALIPESAIALLPDDTSTSDPDQPSSFLVNVQNPGGAIDYPRHGSTIQGTVPIRGWVHVAGSQIDAVQIWVNGELRGVATYGLPYAGLDGDYGFAWEWETSDEPNGDYTIEVRAVAVNGGSTLLQSSGQERVKTIQVAVRNLFYSIDKWTIR
ncbi:MAG: M23 family metallopeptidase [Chloroflexaceae bacterium]|nr:M23 family metallopeptidase [Chloroflexaceae bacterium]